jgi:hypothetical protein
MAESSVKGLNSSDLVFAWAFGKLEDLEMPEEDMGKAKPPCLTPDVGVMFAVVLSLPLDGEVFFLLKLG